MAFRIFKRKPQSSVLDWSWLFRSMRFLIRSFDNPGPDELKDASLARTVFDPGFFLEVDGDFIDDRHYSASKSYDSVSIADTEMMQHNLDEWRTKLDFNEYGKFCISYAVDFYVSDHDDGNADGPGQPYPYGKRIEYFYYTYVSIDGRRIDESIDLEMASVFGGMRPRGALLEYPFSKSEIIPGQPPNPPPPTVLDVNLHMSGFAIVELIEGVHNVELSLIAPEGKFIGDGSIPLFVYKPRVIASIVRMR